jgi:hypothetical protein
MKRTQIGETHTRTRPRPHTNKPRLNNKINSNGKINIYNNSNNKYEKR